MFFTYRSNHLHFLLLKAHQIIQKQPLSNIFEKEIFIHDSQILFQYLNIFLAQNTGITANFKLYHPDDFIWRFFEKIIFKKKIKNLFTNSVMMWKIIKILNKKNFFTIFHQKHTIKKFKFSSLISNIFKEYILYRPSWINAWSRGENISQIKNNEKWQIKLWLAIIDDMKKNKQPVHNFANMFHTFNILLKEKKIKKIYFPNRIFVISSFALNPSYITIFKKISLYTNVYFLYITPHKNHVSHANTMKNCESIKKKKIKQIF